MLTVKQRDEWVAALESGDFIKGTGTFRAVKDDGTVVHCCLGVFCEINRQPVKVHGGEHGLDNYQYIYGALDDDGKEQASVVSQLWIANDDESTPDYSKVIPIIREMPVQS